LEYRATKKYCTNNKLKDIFAEIEGFEGELTPKIIDRYCQGDQKRFDYAGKLIKDETVLVIWTTQRQTGFGRS
jgi:hypothetical protein